MTSRSLVVWSLERFAERALDRFGGELVYSLSEVATSVDEIVVVGGGTMMDQAKLWRASHRSDIYLTLVPTLWGSGAEASPVVVLNGGSGKEIQMGSQFLPDAVLVWSDVLNELPLAQARAACGDTWAHALEGFLSPLASPEVRYTMAAAMKSMMQLPLGIDERWFPLSAVAAATQANASVGLIHGIAHTLELYLHQDVHSRSYGHAALCATYFAPVMEFNRLASKKFDDLLGEYRIDPDQVLAVGRELFDPVVYDETKIFLAEYWTKILRDQCSRTNSTLVRRSSLEWFVQYDIDN